MAISLLLGSPWSIAPAEEPSAIPYDPAVEIVVGPLWTEPAEPVDAQSEKTVHPAQLICFSLQASGARWDWLQLDLRLRLPDGSPLVVAHSASETATADPERGAPFHVGSRVPVLRNLLAEKRLCAKLAADMLPAGAELPDRAIANLRAAGAGASAECEAELSLRAVGKTRAIRALRVLAVDVSLHFDERTQSATRRPPGSWDQSPGRRPTLPAAQDVPPQTERHAASRGRVQVLVYVEAIGLSGQSLTGQITLIPEAKGRPPGQKTPERGDETPPFAWRQTRSQRVLADQAQIFEFTAPLSDWSKGDRPHRVTVNFEVRSQSLRAAQKMEFAIRPPR